jgi:hypothetical protein
MANPIISSITRACDRLQLARPHDQLIDLPNANGTSKSVTSAAAILFEKMNEGVTVLMVHETWKKGACAFPGGFRAGAPEDKYDKSTAEQKENEEFFPLLTAARELSEEIPFLFQSQGVDTLKNIYAFLNDGSTRTLRNSGWNQFPILNYVRQLSQLHSEVVTKALNGEISVVSEEVTEISRISLVVLKQAFASHKWTKEGLEGRAKLISEASARKEKADLKDFKQYEQPISLTNTLGKTVAITEYAARSIFNSLDDIERLTA